MALGYRPVLSPLGSMIPHYPTPLPELNYIDNTETVTTTENVLECFPGYNSMSHGWYRYYISVPLILDFCYLPRRLVVLKVGPRFHKSSFYCKWHLETLKKQQLDLELLTFKLFVGRSILG